jgi:hypothetical protein
MKMGVNGFQPPQESRGIKFILTLDELGTYLVIFLIFGGLDLVFNGLGPIC